MNVESKTTSATVLRSELTSAVKAVSKLRDTKGVRAWEKMIRIRINGSVHVSGSNLDSVSGHQLEIGDRSAGEPSDDVGLLVNPERLTEALRKLGRAKARQTIRIEADIDGDAVGMSVAIGDGESVKRADVSGCQSVETYPDLSAYSGDGHNASAVVTVGELRKAITQTEFAMDTESLRYALGGLCFEIDGHGFTVTATDGRRLSTINIGSLAGRVPEIRQTMVIPAKAISATMAHLAKRGASERVTVSLYALGASIVGDDWHVRTSAVEGRFPNWRDIIPSKTALTTRITARADDLLNGLEPILDPPSFTLHIRDDGSMFFQSRAVEFSSGAWNRSLKAIADNSIDKTEMLKAIAFDCQYLADYLQTLPELTEVTVSFRDCESAFTLSADQCALYVVMPISIDR